MKRLTGLILTILRRTGRPLPPPPATSGSSRAPAVSSRPPAVGYYLSEIEMDRFRKNWPDYRWACELVPGILEIALAAVNYRETGGLRTTKIEGGWCQLDLGGSGAEHRRRLQAYANRACQTYGAIPGDLATDFGTGCIVAAHLLKTKLGNRRMVRAGVTDWDGLAWALWGYNGRSKYHTEDGTPSEERRSWRWSPYVSNDPKRGVVLRIKGTIPDGKGGRKQIDRPDPRPGALAIARELEERIPA